ncbi:aminopeptidase N [Sphingomonas changbaiensis NBRC 104936]|uniref:Aminopeptidase N n=1 Tax=Sphingomonas changbaiensis NBRC 104936 TaxID=1219043 RepID=A0A0E9MKT8_9SPHN|nr:aminopeptidase N [Sphingomonas changbaiensis]GAO38154.1 aminopeptidase N [Sphingomonas changbaiensis NBRC 104936]
MADVQTTAAAAPQVTRREDYTPPAWRVPEIALEFELDPARTVVRSRMEVERAGPGPLRLDHGRQEIVAVRVDGAPAEYRDEGGKLVLDLPRDSHVIETECVVVPEANTELMGLYASGGMLCTQCEAEGFRRITPFPDRPDVLSRYSVKMTADKTRFPVLLANGDRFGSGDLPDGRHWAEWRDPFFKPCYLFALVAGDLKANRDHFTTMSGRQVELGIWVREADLPKTAHAMQALKDSMAWDERTYGREYDLDVFNIVAVADFNFGAMENKGLNIFNSRYILADPETATDADYDAIAAVVAHEYFHNWSGNRVTCRDWFQLSLKEGLTVFRDQSFSADHGSAAVERINQVRMLRASQFQEDAGPLAHPVRPDSYIEIGNFYTATVYNKGAELIRMMATMLGPERYRRGTDLYFERHDGQAVTCDDFVKAMEDGGGIDLSQFRLWYSQAGTPKVKATVRQDGRDAIVSLEQTVPPTPGQSDKKPMPIPLRMAMFGGGTGSVQGEERLVVLDEARADVRFEGVGERPVLSINRGFSAPIIVESDRGAADLALLSAHDDDPFARYEALQQLMLDTLIARVEAGVADFAPVLDAVRLTVENPALDKAFIAEAVLPPSEAFIGDRMASVDPEAVHQAREALRAELGRLLEGQWRAAYLGSASNRFELTPPAKGARRLRSIALGFLMAGGAEDAPALAWDQFQGATNMTDRQGALTVLVSSDAPQREDAIAAFYARHKDDALVLDKWFTTQALSTRADALDQVLKLAQHPDFTLTNPNRARSLVGAFSANQRGFHSGEGEGYRFLADNILALDAINPQTAAKFVAPLGRWRRFGETRGALMRAELERIVAKPGLSKDVFEQASKSLA